MSAKTEKVIRSLYDAFAAGDTAAIDALFDDKIRWIAPGKGKHAGTRKGKQALFASMGALAELTGGTLRGELTDVIADGDRAVVFQVTKGKRKGYSALNDEEIIVYRVADGKVVEAREYPGDVYAMDEFFA